MSGRLSPLCLSLEQPALVALLGANGSGKSSLLLAMANLLPASGAVCLDGSDLLAMPMVEAARYRAMLPQRQPFLMPLLCHRVLQLGQSMLVASEAALGKAFITVVARLELEPLLARDFSQLSGGEQQRVLLAKTLLQIWPETNPQARLLLLDEPLAGLDWHHQLALLSLLAQLVASGITVIFSVHDFNLALQWADQLIALRAGELLVQGATGLLDETLIAELYHVPMQRIEQEGYRLFVPSRPRGEA